MYGTRGQCHPFLAATVLAMALVFFAGSAGGDELHLKPLVKPLKKPGGTVLGAVPRPWTDYVMDSLTVERDATGQVKVQALYKNIGDKPGATPWIAFGLDRPGADWIEVYGNNGGWYVLPDKLRMGATSAIRAKVDSHSDVVEASETNNECSVTLGPNATRAVSACR